MKTVKIVTRQTLITFLYDGGTRLDYGKITVTVNDTEAQNIQCLHEAVVDTTINWLPSEGEPSCAK